MAVLEKICRFFLAGWFSICVIDGWGYLLFDVYLTGAPGDLLFLAALMKTKWFWWTFKIIQTYGVLSLLFNYRPVLALSLLAPSSLAISLFYFFDLTPFAFVGVLILLANAYLFKAYWPNLAGLLRQPEIPSAKPTKIEQAVSTNS